MTRPDLLGVAGVAALLAAAMVSLDGVFLDATWRGPTVGAAGLALVIAVGVRELRFGATAALLATAVGWITFTYVTHLPPGGLLPGPEQAREFAALWQQGLIDIAEEPAPARALPGLLVVVSTATWWMTHLTHELMVRLERPGAALLAATAFWVIPLAVPQSGGRTWPQTIPFLAAAALVLLVHPDPEQSGVDRAGQRPFPVGAGTTMGIVAIVIATIAPGVLPGYGDEGWVDLAGANAARGYQPIVDVSNRLRLPEERPLLRVHSERPVYLRLAGLDTFDGASWRLGPSGRSTYSPEDVLPADRDLPPEVEIRERSRLNVHVENLSLENVFVPVPYHPVRIRGSAAERMVYSREGTFLATSETLENEPALVPGLSYEVEAAVPDPTADDLRSVGFDAFSDPLFERWLDLPQPYDELRAEAERYLAEVGATTPFDIALALQAYYRHRERFTYSIDVDPLRDPAALTRFVLEDRRGYCEYFATGMAVMLRQLGIPTRVAVGFRLGDRIAAGEYLVTTADAHAWVEVLFPGYGWIQFEPTPALADTLVPTADDVTPTLALGEAVSSGQNVSGLGPDPELSQLLNEAGMGAEGALPEAGAEAGAGTGRGPLPVAAGILAALVAVGAVVAGLGFAGTHRHHRPRLGETERILAAQRRLLARARGLGLARNRSETAREVAGRWGAEGRVDPDAARRFAKLAQSAAFGGHIVLGQAAEAEDLGHDLGEALGRSVPRSRRVFAPIRLPLEVGFEQGRERVRAAKDRVGV
ncbi:MAG: transglutaminase TgpA family protein [Nitriliruptorales bacterium]